MDIVFHCPLRCFCSANNCTGDLPPTRSGPCNHSDVRLDQIAMSRRATRSSWQFCNLLGSAAKTKPSSLHLKIVPENGCRHIFPTAFCCWFLIYIVVGRVKNWIMWKSNPKLKHGSGLFFGPRFSKHITYTPFPWTPSPFRNTIEPRNVTWNLKKKSFGKGQLPLWKVPFGWGTKKNFPTFSQQT